MRVWSSARQRSRSRTDELVALLLALEALDTLLVHLFGQLLVSLLFGLLGSLLADRINLALRGVSHGQSSITDASPYLTRFLLLCLHLVLFGLHLRHERTLLGALLVGCEACGRAKSLFGCMPLLACPPGQYWSTQTHSPETYHSFACPGASQPGSLRTVR